MPIELEFSSDAPGGPTLPTETEGTEAVPIGSAVTDDTGAPAGQITDHAGLGLKRLCLYFQKKPRMAAYLRAVMSEVQRLEDLIWACYILDSDPDLTSVGGVHLDTLGVIVGEPRIDRTDAQYRPGIRARIKINKSDGKIEQLYEIMALISPGTTYAIRQYYPASMVAHFGSIGGARASDVSRMLNQARAAGVRLDVGYGGGTVGSTRGTPVGDIVGSTRGTPTGFLVGSATGP